MLFKTLRKGVLARFIVGAAAMGASDRHTLALLLVVILQLTNI